MSKNITLFGQDFSNVPALNVPLQGGGTAKFTEISDTDAVASDVASGKYFYTADGTKTEGTASGGGSSYTLLGSAEYTVNTTSATNITVGTLNIPSAYNSDYILYVKVRNKSGRVDGTLYGTDSFLMNQYQKYNKTTALQYGQFYTVQYVADDWDPVIVKDTGQYGVYPTLLTSSGELTISARYDSTITMTINSTFTVEVYALNWPDNVIPFI